MKGEDSWLYREKSGRCYLTKSLISASSVIRHVDITYLLINGMARACPLCGVLFQRSVISADLWEYIRRAHTDGRSTKHQPSHPQNGEDNDKDRLWGCQRGTWPLACSAVCWIPGEGKASVAELGNPSKGSSVVSGSHQRSFSALVNVMWDANIGGSQATGAFFTVGATLLLI